MRGFRLFHSGSGSESGSVSKSNDYDFDVDPDSDSDLENGIVFRMVFPEGANYPRCQDRNTVGRRVRE